MNPYAVLLKPIISEKSNQIREKTGQYTFKIHKDADKLDVKRAVEKLFDVKVDSVRTAITRGKIRRRGQFLGKPRSTKKAVVKLVKGQTLKIFEDQ